MLPIIYKPFENDGKSLPQFTQPKAAVNTEHTLNLQ